MVWTLDLDSTKALQNKKQFKHCFMKGFIVEVAIYLCMQEKSASLSC